MWCENQCQRKSDITREIFPLVSCLVEHKPILSTHRKRKTKQTERKKEQNESGHVTRILKLEVHVPS